MYIQFLDDKNFLRNKYTDMRMTPWEWEYMSTLSMNWLSVCLDKRVKFMFQEIDIIDYVMTKQLSGVSG